MEPPFIVETVAKAAPANGSAESEDAGDADGT